MQKRVDGLRWLAWCLFAATVVKIAAVIFASPMVGYANNYDFVRSSECTGVWSSANGAVAVPHHRAPRAELLYDGRTDAEGCMVSFDNLFVRLARLPHAVGDTFVLREVGAWKLALLVAGVAVLLAVVRQSAVLLACAVVFGLVFGDMSVLPYFNSMYAEFSVVGGLFFAMAACAWLCAVPQWPGLGRVALLLGPGVVWLGFSKQQYGFFASALLVYAGLVLVARWRRWRLAGALAVLALAMPLSFAALNPSDRVVMQSIAKANKFNTFFWAVLPAASDKDAALQTLRLPASCRGAIGLSWFTPGLEDHKPCPEIVQASRRRLPLLFAQDAATFLVPMRHAVASTRPLYPVYLAWFERPGDAQRGKYVLMRETSFSRWVERLPDPAYGGVALLLMGLGVVMAPGSLLLCMRRGAGDNPGRADVASRDRSGLRLVACLLGLGGMAIVYSLASSVFGDGYADFPKHAVGALVGAAFGLAGLVLGCAALCSRGTAALRPSPAPPAARAAPCR